MAYGLNLSQREKAALKELSQKKGMSQRNVLRASFRFYQSIEVLLEQGRITQKDIQKLFDTGLRKKEKKK